MLAWWARVSGALVQCVRAVGARGEGWAACVGGWGAAGCGRSSMGHVGSHGGSVEAVWIAMEHAVVSAVVVS